MEKIIVTILLGLLCSTLGTAQTEYEAKMTEALELWNQQKKAEAVDLFEEIARTEETNWLPYYYAAQVKVIDAFSIIDSTEKEEQLKEAQLLLDESMKLSEQGNVENQVLQAMLHTAYLTLDPMRYGAQLSPIITGIYENAAKAHPENPRVALEHTEWKIGSARFFGEDTGKYCSDLKAVLVLFEKEQPGKAFAPQWGEERAKMLLAETCGDDVNTQKAK